MSQHNTQWLQHDGMQHGLSSLFPMIEEDLPGQKEKSKGVKLKRFCYSSDFHTALYATRDQN